MADVIVVTNRKLCRGDFLERIRKLAAARPAGIVLREKDLPSWEYFALARQVVDICAESGCPCILHTQIEAAKMLHTPLHLPMDFLRRLGEEERASIRTIGASCHSAEDVKEAETLGCKYVTAGHIFETDCKKGVPARGLAFLEEICSQTKLAVFAIGGIDRTNLMLALRAGARGGCVMSGAMTCPDPEKYLKELYEI